MSGPPRIRPPTWALQSSFPSVLRYACRAPSKPPMKTRSSPTAGVEYPHEERLRFHSMRPLRASSVTIVPERPIV